MKKGLLGKIRDKLMESKLTIARAVSYMVLANSGMILFLFLSNLKENGIIGFDVGKYYLPILGIGMITFFIIGWIEINVFKGYESENRYTFSKSPPHVEMKRKIDELYNKLIVGENQSG